MRVAGSTKFCTVRSLELSSQLRGCTKLPAMSWLAFMFGERY